jgi:hypothetical protein
MTVGKVIYRPKILGGYIQIAGYMAHRIQYIVIGKLQFVRIVLRLIPQLAILQVLFHFMILIQ